MSIFKKAEITVSVINQDGSETVVEERKGVDILGAIKDFGGAIADKARDAANAVGNSTAVTAATTAVSGMAAATRTAARHAAAKAIIDTKTEVLVAKHRYNNFKEEVNDLSNKIKTDWDAMHVAPPSPPPAVSKSDPDPKEEVED